jgi:hypothetical protein
MSYLASGPAPGGDRQQSECSQPPKQICSRSDNSQGGGGMSYLPRGPALAGIDSKASAASRRRRFVRAQTTSKEAAA